MAKYTDTGPRLGISTHGPGLSRRSYRICRWSPFQLGVTHHRYLPHDAPAFSSGRRLGSNRHLRLSNGSRAVSRESLRQGFLALRRSYRICRQSPFQLGITHHRYPPCGHPVFSHDGRSRNYGTIYAHKWPKTGRKRYVKVSSPTEELQTMAKMALAAWGCPPLVSSA